MSKSINKQEGKGDLLIDDRDVEVKTTDGGAGRFTDQEVRPGAGFDKAARELNEFIRQYQPGLPKSGPNLDVLVKFYQTLSSDPKARKESTTLIKLLTTVIQNIFDGEDVSNIINAIKNGNVNAAKQEYAKTNFNYYMNKKKDEGVLYISLVKDPIMTVFFKDADELAASGLRLHAGTAYITSVADVRLPYPQIEIVDTKAGPSAVGAEVTDNIPVSTAATSASDLDTVASTPRLTGPGAKAARTSHEPRMDRATLGREYKG
jgi:hypothetical protein